MSASGEALQCAVTFPDARLSSYPQARICPSRQHVMHDAPPGALPRVARVMEDISCQDVLMDTQKGQLCDESCCNGPCNSKIAKHPRSVCERECVKQGAVTLVVSQSPPASSERAEGGVRRVRGLRRLDGHVANAQPVDETMPAS